MTLSDRFLRHFSRVTSSGRFIPEIDGFRFIAIASVFLFHLTGQMEQKSRHFTAADTAHDWLAGLTKHGDHGVPLFFVISGFILGLPFAVQHLLGGRRVNIREFYLRRLTRLEPPYVLALLLLSSKSVAVSHLVLPWLARALYVSAFRGVFANAVVTNRWLTTIGGMCYSIYLLHFAAISLVYRHTQSLTITHLFWLNLLLQSLIVGTVTLMIFALFFIGIEKPCMQKDWPAHLRARLRGLAPRGGASPAGGVSEHIEHIK